MENQIPFYFRLRIQCFTKSPNGKIAGNTTVCNAGYHASVMQIYDCTVVANFMICKKKIREISTPFLINPVSSKILFELIVKYFVRFAMFVSGLLWTYNRPESEFNIHIFMNCCQTVKIAFSLQIDFHASVTIYSIV